MHIYHNRCDTSLVHVYNSIKKNIFINSDSKRLILQTRKVINTIHFLPQIWPQYIHSTQHEVTTANRLPNYSSHAWIITLCYRF